MKKKSNLYPKTSSPCNYMNIRRASRSVTQFYDYILAPSGLSITQMGILSIISTLPDPSMNRLAENIRIDRTTLNRNLKPLLNQGYIELIHGKDTRKREAILTQEGTRSLETAHKLWIKAQQSIKEYLGDTELQQLKKILLKLESINY